MKSIFDFSTSGQVKFEVGKYEGERLSEVVEKDGQYLEWFKDQDISGKDKNILEMALSGISEDLIEKTYRANKRDRTFPVTVEGAQILKDVEVGDYFAEKQKGPPEGPLERVTDNRPIVNLYDDETFKKYHVNPETEKYWIEARTESGNEWTGPFSFDRIYEILQEDYFNWDWPGSNKWKDKIMEKFEQDLDEKIPDSL